MDTASENAESPGSTEAGGATPSEAGGPPAGESGVGADDPQTTVGPGETVTDPETAFSRLGNETRLRTIRTLAADGPQTFTALFEGSAADTTAGFAYHLRQITGHYVEKHGGDEEPRYHLTSAGRAVARALDAGVYTDRVERGPKEVDGECPLCGADSLSAGLADNRVSVACTDCETALLSLPFPPSGARDRTLPELLDAFDSYHRQRLSLVADGVCPDCAGPIQGEIEGADPPNEREAERPVVVADCEACPFRVRAPVSLFVCDHPDVVSFLDSHEVEAGPIWNLGTEWRESVLSTEPWAVRVSVHTTDAVLDLLVGDGPTVVDASRSSVAADSTAGG